MIRQLLIVNIRCDRLAANYPNHIHSNVLFIFLCFDRVNDQLFDRSVIIISFGRLRLQERQLTVLYSADIAIAMYVTRKTILLNCTKFQHLIKIT